MRLFFTGPRILGIRPGLSFDAASLLARPAKRSPGELVTGSFVYVVRGDHNMVKIGVTTNPDARLAQLRTGSAFPIEYAYLGVTPGTGYDIEQAAHAALSRQRCHGEWFDCPPEMAVAAISGAAYKLGQPVQPIQPGMAAQVLRIASQGTAQKTGWRTLQILYFVAIGLITAFFVFVILITKGNAYRYGGGRHTSSHGGSYHVSCDPSCGSSHKGGSYDGPHGGYGKHRR